MRGRHGHPVPLGNLLVAVGEDRSSAAVASATAAALERSGGSGVVLGVLAYAPSLPFYLAAHRCRYRDGSRAHQQLHRDNVERFRSLPGSPLLPAGYWREALARCPMATVFLTGAGHREARAALSAALPLLAADDHYAAYGPSRTSPAGWKGAVVCGIFGAVSLSAPRSSIPTAYRPWQPRWLIAVPTASASWVTSARGGARRLAIMDLTTGDQPFQNPDAPSG